ncbi:MAG: hypothetical protein IT321_22965 [Anaerolineae bacterium]|nr:hypothetical protein [Anaerolineae bacterium]
MNRPSPIPAFIAYLLPVFGWLYVYLFQRSNSFAVFHLRQAIGLVLFLIGTLLVWAVAAWLIAQIPFAAMFSVATFSVVMAAYMFGVVIWVLGMMNALRNKSALLPLIGEWANRLPIV